MKDYMVMSCQLELMWIHTVNYEAIPDFMPAKRVSRAEFGTILSRVLWWDTYEGTNENYYINHLNALHDNNIITNIDPNITEYRAWVFLMIYRSVETIKLSKAAPKQSIENQVNEELAEEWKAETGLVVEYDSWSVVPEMATITESGSLTTWAVAEVETWTTIWMPNPAAVYCEEQGWTVDLDSWKCKLADGTEVDEWEYYRENNKDAEAETGSTTD